MSKIVVELEKCVGCNSCVRACPVGDANRIVKNDNGKLVIEIDESKCIKCGACIKACSHHARTFEDDMQRFLEDLKKGEKIAIIVAPAIKIAFDVNLPEVKIYSEFEFDMEPGLEGAIYPRPGGLATNLLYHNPNLEILNIEGPSHVYRELEKYIAEKDIYKPQVLDVLNCEFGCNEGPAVGQDYNFMQMNSVMHSVEQYTHQERVKTTKRGKDKQFAKFDKELKLEDFFRTYTPENTKKIDVSNAQLEEAFNTLGKKTNNERHFDCHACGFSSCTDMAKAIAQGLNYPGNCHQYMMNQIMEERKQITRSHEQVHEITQELQKIVADLKQRVVAVQSEATSIGEAGRRNIDEMGKVVTYLSSLTELNTAILAAMKDINVNVDNYREMSKNVEKIAQNINLLSLNASIEAARAVKPDEVLQGLHPTSVTFPMSPKALLQMPRKMMLPSISPSAKLMTP